MKISLIFPPQWDPYMPYLALPWLGTYLEENGCEVVMHDLNIETYHLFLNEEFLKNSFTNAVEMLARLEAKNNLTEKEHSKIVFLQKMIACSEYIIKEVGLAKQVYKSKSFYDPDKLMKSYKIINEALKLATACYFPTVFSLERFAVFGYDIWASKDLAAAVQDVKINPFKKIFKEYFLDSILMERPEVVGISITGWWQVIPGLTLAALLKETKPGLFICIGGQAISRWEDFLPEAKQLFEFFDTAIVREGEVPLLELLETLKKGEELKRVPNLIYRSGEEIKVNPVGEMVDINSIPTPSFEKLPLEMYLFPGLVIPLYTARGCYWRKCAFCDHWHGYENYYVKRDMELVREDLQHIITNYKTNLIALVDEITPPERLKAFSKIVIELDININWFLAQRFEKGYTPGFCDFIHKAGCTLIVWGMESGCQRTLDNMFKGTDIGLIEKVLRNTAEAGIWNYTAVVHGFPTETQAESNETIDFVLDRCDIIKGLYSNIFNLSTWTDVNHTPERYCIDKLEDSNRDLTFFYRYTSHYGLSYSEARVVRDRLLQEFEDKQPYYELFNSLHWVYTFIYLTELGYKKVETIRLHFGKPAPFPHYWKKTVMKLREGVVFITTASGPVLWDIFNQKSFSISDAVRRIIQFGDQGKSLEEAAKNMAETYNISLHDAEKKIVDVAKNLAAKSVITFREFNRRIK